MNISGPQKLVLTPVWALCWQLFCVNDECSTSSSLFQALSPCRLCKGVWDPASAGTEPGRCKHCPLHRDTARSPSSTDRSAKPPPRTAGRHTGTAARRKSGMRDKHKGGGGGDIMFSILWFKTTKTGVISWDNLVENQVYFKNTRQKHLPSRFKTLSGLHGPHYRAVSANNRGRWRKYWCVESKNAPSTGYIHIKSIFTSLPLTPHKRA